MPRNQWLLHTAILLLLCMVSQFEPVVSPRLFVFAVVVFSPPPLLLVLMRLLLAFLYSFLVAAAVCLLNLSLLYFLFVSTLGQDVGLKLK